VSAFDPLQTIVKLQAAAASLPHDTMFTGMKLSDYCQAIGSVISAAFACALYVATRKQAQITHRQNDISDTQTKILENQHQFSKNLERSLLIVDSINSIQIFNERNAHHDWFAHVIIKNIGRTPANIITVTYDIQCDGVYPNAPDPVPLTSQYCLPDKSLEFNLPFAFQFSQHAENFISSKPGFDKSIRLQVGVMYNCSADSHDRFMSTFFILDREGAWIRSTPANT
jgi:hypothetical protein